MKFQTGKQKRIVENLYAVRQKGENFVEGKLLEWDVKLEM
jgi:hypothetical protein